MFGFLMLASGILLVVVAVLVVLWVVWKPAWMGFSGRTLWDWISLLAVPAVLWGAGLIFNEGQAQREEARASAEALQAYVDRITALVIDPGMADRPESFAAAGRAQTTAVLSQIRSRDAGTVLRYLAEIGTLADFAPSFEGTDLTGAELKELDLEGVDFEGAILIGADLEDAELSGVDFEGADLTRADFKGADLRGADFEGALLDDTDFSGARLDGADLSAAENLTARQLRTACIGSATVLPAGIGDVAGECRREDDD
ncbi:pentapeptide repeat-containing protein [Pelagovum pacificum]|nr:pentapeptide repeat-containing protein [Pelagovum pacificum]QQA43999.1 pentapeptide repeat-containing protein [Pelagovum pacificum]